MRASSNQTYLLTSTQQANQVPSGCECWDCWFWKVEEVVGRRKLWGGGDFRSYSTIRQALLMVYTDPFTTHFVCTEEIDGKLNHSQVLIYALLFPPGLHLYNCSALVVFFLNIRKRKKEITLHFFVGVF